MKIFKSISLLVFSVIGISVLMALVRYWFAYTFPYSTFGLLWSFAFGVPFAYVGTLIVGSLRSPEKDVVSPFSWKVLSVYFLLVLGGLVWYHYGVEKPLIAAIKDRSVSYSLHADNEIMIYIPSIRREDLLSANEIAGVAVDDFSWIGGGMNVGPSSIRHIGTIKNKTDFAAYEVWAQKMCGAGDVVSEKGK